MRQCHNGHSPVFHLSLGACRHVSFRAAACPASRISPAPVRWGMTYLYLITAIVFEVIGTAALQASEQFTRPKPLVLTAFGYIVAFYFLSLVLRTMPVGGNSLCDLVRPRRGADYPCGAGLVRPAPRCTRHRRAGADHRRCRCHQPVFENRRPLGKTTCPTATFSFSSSRC